MNQTRIRNTTPSFVKSAIPLSLTIRPSATYLAAIVVFHLLAIAATGSAAVPTAGKLFLTALAVVSVTVNVVLSTSTRQLTWHAENRWTLNLNHRRRTSPQYVEATLTSVDFLSRWLVILTLQTEKRRAERIVIPFDSMSKDRYRLLRVRLRIEAHRLLNPPAYLNKGP